MASAGITAVAAAFFEACETGKGKEGVAEFITDGATFTCQAVDAMPGPPITECKTVAAYADWMKGVCDAMGEKATYAIDTQATDEERSTVIFVATFAGFSHYVYTVHINSDAKVDAVTKIWNDSYSFKIVSSMPAPDTEGS
mmetsp:Transcript_128432/g.256535  ORF Transcript_128432/g.256535 Transcript_128432/m.256535 type:complete len:141 (+) Transcript_128432:95-517(+)